MGTPITWQNINAPSFTDASRLFESAQRSINGAFEGIGGVLKDRRALEDANWNQVKTNNTNNALNTINQFATPEEFAAAQKAGAIQALLASHGAQIDQQAVRGAADQRLSILQQRAKQGIDYTNTMRDSQEAGIRDEIASKLNSGDPALIAQAKAQLAQVQLREEASLALAGNNASQQLVDRSRATTKFGWEGEDQVAQMAAARDALLTNANQRANSSAQVGIARDSLNLRRDEMKDAREQRDEAKVFDRQAKVRAELGSLYSENANSPQAAEKFADLLKGVKDENTQNNMRVALTQMLKNPDATTGSVMNALTGMDANHWWKLDSISRSQAVNAAKELEKSLPVVQQKLNTEVRKKQLATVSNQLALKAAEIAGDKAEAARIKKLLERDE